MKATGIVRKVDELGRVVLPCELRKSLHIAERDPLEIYTDGEQVILKKYEPACIFTGSAENLIEFKGRKISKDSIKEMAELAGLL
jgi:transcriptional pleiotropic regulator of transition state genes